MNHEEIKRAIKAKTIEFEIAMSLKKPYEELLRLYKELKELRFRLVQHEYDLRKTA